MRTAILLTTTLGLGPSLACTSTASQAGTSTIPIDSQELARDGVTAVVSENVSRFPGCPEMPSLDEPHVAAAVDAVCRSTVYEGAVIGYAGELSDCTGDWLVIKRRSAT